MSTSTYPIPATPPAVLAPALDAAARRYIAARTRSGDALLEAVAALADARAAYRERHGDARRAYNREYMRAARGGLKPTPPPAEPCKHGRVGWCKACWAKRTRDAKKAAA